MTYRRLAMISFLHRYFLDTDDKEFFTLPAAEKDSRLVDLIIKGKLTLMNDLVIEPTPQTKDILKAHKIIYKVLQQGILLGSPVTQETIQGVVRSKPMIAFPKDLRLQFTIRSRNNFASYSLLRMNPVVPALYYLTNEDLMNVKTPPSLAVPVANFQAGRVYEMGELAIVGGNVSQSLQKTNSSNANHWQTVTDNHYVTEYDRRLLPKKFSYTFDQSSITEATFTLKKDSDVLKTLTFNNAAGLTAVELDLAHKDDNTKIGDGHYKLEVTGQNNYSWSSDVYLLDTIPGRSLWGFLDIAVHTSNSLFSLIDVDGFLPVDPLKYPHMELRFASRSTYWKYYFQKQAPTAQDLSWDVLQPPPGISKLIMSKKPITLLSGHRKVKYATNLLPNPGGMSFSRHADKLCSDILLTTIKL